MSSNKIFGYILILIGLAIIILAICQSYQIFTGKEQVPQVFVVSEKASKGGNVLDQTQQAIQKQLENILPTDSVFRLLNLLSWSILALILIFGGGQIAGIGVKLATSKENNPVV